MYKEQQTHICGWSKEREKKVVGREGRAIRGEEKEEGDKL